MRVFNLLVDSVDNTLHGWLEKLGDILSVKHSANANGMDLSSSPCQLQLSVANVARRIIVFGASELDVLLLLVCAEANLRRLVKTSHNVVYIIVKVGLLKITWVMRMSIWGDSKAEKPGTTF